jgi:hypothetical protein
MKIFTNSYPRSGATTFSNAIRNSTYHLRPPFADELYNQNDWVNKNHNPVIFLGTYPEDVVPVTIVKDPLDAITSNSFRWSKGHTGNVVHGSIIIDKDQIRNDTFLDEGMKRLIDHQMDQYLSYIFCYMQNPDNVVAFTYDQTQKNAVDCIKNIAVFANIDPNDLQEDQIHFSISHPPHPTGEKTVMYHKIREYIQNSEKFVEVTREYNRALDYIKAKQVNYPIKIEFNI